MEKCPACTNIFLTHFQFYAWCARCGAIMVETNIEIVVTLPTATAKKYNVPNGLRIPKTLDPNARND